MAQGPTWTKHFHQAGCPQSRMATWGDGEPGQPLWGNLIHPQAALLTGRGAGAQVHKPGQADDKWEQCRGAAVPRPTSTTRALSSHCTAVGSQQEGFWLKCEASPPVHPERRGPRSPQRGCRTCLEEQQSRGHEPLSLVGFFFLLISEYP